MEEKNIKGNPLLN